MAVQDCPPIALPATRTVRVPLRRGLRPQHRAAKTNIPQTFGIQAWLRKEPMRLDGSYTWFMIDMEPKQLVSAQDMADALKITRVTASELIAAEAAGRAFAHGRAIFTWVEAIAALEARRRPADTSIPALNVKVRAARWSDDEDRYIGWHARLTEDQLELAIGRWWAVRDADAVKGAALVATIGGWVVAVSKIVGVETNRGQRSFRLAAPTELQRRAYENRRLPPQAGSLVQRFGGL
jgi:hypothetical protein